MACPCRCHAYGAGTHITCDHGPEIPGGRSCTPLHGDQPVSLVKAKCRHCGVLAGRTHQPADGDCILPHRYGIKHHPPRARAGNCCRGCVHRHRDTLTEILELWALLPQVVELGSVPDDTAEHSRAKKQPASPAPFRVLAWALLHGPLPTKIRATGDDGNPIELDGDPIYVDARLGAFLPNVPGLLAYRARLAVESGAMATTIKGKTTDPVSTSVIQLRAAAEHVAAQPWVDEYDAELGWILRKLREAHGIEELPPLGDCILGKDGRECRGKVREQASGHPKCDRCGREYDTHDLVRMQIAQGERTNNPKARPPRQRLASSREGQGRA
jgi:hypothetical protein